MRPKIESLQAISDEVESARKKFPGNTKRLAALMEEVGEVAKAMIEHGADSEECRAEAIQVAAMAIRILEEGDAEHDLPYLPEDADTQPGLLDVRMTPIETYPPLQMMVYGGGGCMAGPVPDNLEWGPALDTMIDAVESRGGKVEMIIMSPLNRRKFAAYLGNADSLVAWRGLGVIEDVDCPTIWVGEDIRKEKPGAPL